MKILQVMQRRMKKSSDFLSNQNPPEKSGCGPSIPIFPASSHSATDIKNSKQLRKFTFPRHNLQLLSSGVSVGVCSDQLQSGKLFNSEESFQKKFSGLKDGGDYDKGEVIVRTLAKKSEDKFKSLGRIIAKEKTFDHADPSSRGNKCVNVVYVMIPY